MPLLDAFGLPLKSSTPTVEYVGPKVRLQKQLSKRDTQIIRAVRLWENSKKLTPMLACRLCFNNSRPHTADHIDEWQVQLAHTALGAQLAMCGCTQWTCEESVPLDADVPDVLPTLEAIQTIGKKQRPLSKKEFDLLQAWKYVMDAHQWTEFLYCQACLKSQKPDGVKCILIPDKSATFDCACSERHYLAPK
jgi:hypothetical protein